MTNPKIYLRQGNIVFSKEFIDVLRDNGIIPTRKNIFNRSGIIINHGNSKPYSIGRNVRELYFLNNPDAIHICCNKKHNWNILRDFYPKVYSNSELNEDIEFPIIAKPINGHHGYGIIEVGDRRQLDGISNKNGYIFQDSISIKHEFRFNIFDRDIYQVSHRERHNDTTERGGYIFNYRSLGSNAKISQKFRDWVNEVIRVFHDKIGYDLCHYTIDVMKGDNKEYYLSEINSACGLGEFTLTKLVDTIYDKYENGRLEYYRVK